MRPKSAAPYPHEDQPLPLNIRPKSTAPYPEDDMRGAHLNPSARLPVAGPHADRPGSAFGIRPLSSSSSLAPQTSPGLPSHPAANLPPHLAAGRGRPVSAQPAPGWEPQLPAGYRKPSPGPTGQWQQPPPPQHDPRYGAGIVPAGTIPVGDPTRARLQKPNPNLPPTLQQQQPQYPPAGAAYPPQKGPQGQPGRDYGPGLGPRPGGVANNRPVSDSYGGGAPYPPAGGGRQSYPNNGNGMHPAASNPNLRPAGGPGGRPMSHLSDPAAGRASAPPVQQGGGGRPPLPQQQQVQHQQQQQQRPGGGGPGGGGPGGGGPGGGGGVQGSGGKPAAAATAHPDGKTMGQGPATFEAMGIPQGKSEGDCVSFFSCSFVLPLLFIVFCWAECGSSLPFLVLFCLGGGAVFTVVSGWMCVCIGANLECV